MIFDCFIQALLARVLPLVHEVVLGAVRYFQPGLYPRMALAAGCGALLASAGIFTVGIWLRRMPQRVSTDAQQARIARMQAVAREWLPWLLILAPTPVGGVLILAAGFFGLRVRAAAAMIVLAEVLWRVAPVV